MPRKNILTLLEGGDRRSIGRADQVAAMIPRLPLNATKRGLAVSLMHAYLEDRSSIVKTSALQGLADLARADPTLRLKVMEVLRASSRSGTPAMKARSRKWLLHLEGG